MSVMGGDFDGDFDGPIGDGAQGHTMIVSGFDGDFERILSRFKTRGTITGRFSSDTNNVHIVEREKTMSRKDDILNRMKALEAELTELNKLPDEPTSEGVFPPIVVFRKKFGGAGSSRPYVNSDTEYVYAFIKSPGDGRWYGTGPKSPKGYTWDELMDWLKNSGPFPEVIYLVDGMHEYFSGEEDDA